MGEFFALCSAFSWGVSSVFARKAQLSSSHTKDAGLFLTLVVNNIINLIAIIVMLIISGPVTLNLPGILFFVFGGLFNSCIGRGMFFNSIGYIGAARAGAIKGITPLFVILGGVLVLGETLTFVSWLGVGVLIAGVMVISIDSLKNGVALWLCIDTTGKNSVGKSGDIKGKLKKGIVICLISCIFFAIGNVFRKAGVNFLPNSIIGVSVGSFASLITFSAYMAVNSEKEQMLATLKAPQKDYILAGVASGGALYCLFLSLKIIPVTIANSLAASEPVFTIAISSIFLGRQDAITWKTVIGGLLIFAGAVILVIL